VVGGVLKASRLLARWPHVVRTLEQLRYLCTARDRYRLYRRARRFARRGGIVVSERHPIPENRLLAGPVIARLCPPGSASRWTRLMIRAEHRYYRQITPPDLAIVLRVDPAIAVQRKTDEPATYVRDRAQAVWDTDWTATTARVVDAGRPLAVVLADLRTLLWSEL
jgi:hypothetical protein